MGILNIHEVTSWAFWRKVNIQKLTSGVNIHEMTSWVFWIFKSWRHGHFEYVMELFRSWRFLNIHIQYTHDGTSWVFKIPIVLACCEYLNCTWRHFMHIQNTHEVSLLKYRWRQLEWIDDLRISHNASGMGGQYTGTWDVTLKIFYFCYDSRAETRAKLTTVLYFEKLIMQKVSCIPLENILADDPLPRMSKKGWIFDRRGGCQVTVFDKFMNCAWANYHGLRSLVKHIVAAKHGSSKPLTSNELWLLELRIKSTRILAPIPDALWDMCKSSITLTLTSPHDFMTSLREYSKDHFSKYPWEYSNY